MSSQNVATTLVYMAYNTSTGAYVTGDSANHTLKLVKDGTEASPTNSPAEVDSVNTPGAYKLALTAAETQFGTVWLGGKSSTANVIIIPITSTFEILPTALSNNFVKSSVQDIGGNTTAATNLGSTAANIGRGTCTTGGSTTSIPTSAFSPNAGIVSGQFIGRTIIFDGNTATAALQGQATNITANTSGSTPTFTVTALTNAPASGDTFSVI